MSVLSYETHEYIKKTFVWICIPIKIKAVRLYLNCFSRKLHWITPQLWTQYSCFLQSEQMSDLIKVSGIIIAASSIRSKATKICLQCRGCRTTLNNIYIKPGLEGYALPRKCNTWVITYVVVSIMNDLRFVTILVSSPNKLIASTFNDNAATRRNVSRSR